MKLEISQIASVYSGKDGKCCCGCSGKHYYAKAHQAASSKNRGYEVTDDEVSDRMVKKVVTKINDVMAMPADIQRAYQLDVDSSYVSIVDGTRLYIAYYLEEPDQPTLREALEDAAS